VASDTTVPVITSVEPALEVGTVAVEAVDLLEGSIADEMETSAEVDNLVRRRRRRRSSANDNGSDD
jgi:hypothetical protein